MYRVMLADDEPIMRKALQTLIDWKRLECEVVFVASNGMEVLEHLEEEAPDILVTDIRMPGADGIALTRYVKEHELPVQVIILTAYADFSYAQAAVKYGAADYVTKTGALDGLESAVSRCCSQLEKEKRAEGKDGREEAVENFLRAVLDGSLYDEEELELKYRTLPLRLENYLVLLFRFRLSPETDGDTRSRIHKSLNDFFSIAFEEHMEKMLFIQRDMLCVLLVGVQEGYETRVGTKCGQILEMMDNFLQLSVCVGISGIGRRAGDLKRLYEEAASALDYRFPDGAGKLHFYREGAEQEERRLPEEDKWMEEICAAVEKADAENAVRAFHGLLERQKAFGCTAAAIRSSGMSLQERCRKLLTAGDTEDRSRQGRPGGIAHQIYSCVYLEEYSLLMESLLTNAAQAMKGAAQGRESLIDACLRYIDAHYPESLSVADIAGRIGVNASYLSRIFREETGNTIIHTINEKKLGKAREYLAHTDMKIYEIAELLGFENVTYFSHFFKKHTGLAPKDYKDLTQD